VIGDGAQERAKRMQRLSADGIAFGRDDFEPAERRLARERGSDRGLADAALAAEHHQRAPAEADVRETLSQ